MITILLVKYILEENKLFWGLTLAYILMTIIQQIFAGKALWFTLRNDNHYLLMKGTYRIISLYNYIVMLWSYKFFLMFMSNSSANLDITDFKFTNKKETYYKV